MNSQQRFYLDAMGIQLWEQRDAPPPASEEQEEKFEVKGERPEKPSDRAPSSLNPVPPVETPDVVVQTAAAVERREIAASPTQPLDEGIPSWLDEAPPPEVPMPGMEEEGYFDEAAFSAETAEPVQPAVATLGWPVLQQRVSECVACPELVASRSQTVFGIGNQQADWMIIGEAPSVDEDKLGEPFVGKSGSLFNAMLNALGLRRQQVYIANILKCCTPDNRDPKPEEATACEAFLKRQIALVQPRVILVVGRIAAQNLLKVNTPIGKLRGSVHQYDGNIPVVVTYQPAYLLRSPLEKRKSWADLCLAKSVIDAGG